MGYQRIFNPTSDRLGRRPSTAGVVGDRRDGGVYVYHDENETDQIVLAVNIALATGRPLLVGGLPGSGKSSLASNVARWMQWRYYEEVITARTQARDLLWRFDAVRRLSDAQAQGGVASNAAYVEPGVLWWAFDRDSALRRGLPLGHVETITPPVEPGPVREAPRAVVLIDEIDKADPDVPNSLLVALGSLRFTVEETDLPVVADIERVPLVVITTNDERELPKAFLRRCVVLNLPAPTPERLVRIARAHFPTGNKSLHKQIAKLVANPATTADGVLAPSTAEYLDAIRACTELHLTPDSSEWDVIVRTTLKKRVSLEAASPAVT